MLHAVIVAPNPLLPRAPTLVHPPFHCDGWVYEEKVGAWRMLAYNDGRRVRLISRNAVDHTARFRELVAAIGKLTPHVVVLDGEVAVYDEKLVSRFHLVITDMNLGGTRDGAWLLREARQRGIMTPFIVVSVVDFDDAELRRQGFAAYPRKPLDHHALVDTILAVVRHR
jgi:CheY-like chemotaxis protein